jgi:hypothetical protein
MFNNVQYSPNLTVNLIFYKLLTRQGFDIRPIPTANGEHLLQMTDAEDQKFNALITESNVFPLQGSISRPIAAAAKKPSADETGNSNSDPKKPKRKNYHNAQTMEVWHHCLGHLNATHIVKLSEDDRSGVIIKGSKTLPFYEACQLSEVKKKFSRTLMPQFKCRGEMFHINTGGGGQTLGDPDEMMPSFSGEEIFRSYHLRCNALSLDLFY